VGGNGKNTTPVLGSKKERTNWGGGNNRRPPKNPQGRKGGSQRVKKKRAKTENFKRLQKGKWTLRGSTLQGTKAGKNKWGEEASHQKHPA